MIVDRETGVVRDAEIFVAVLGASNYTYAEATWTQTLPDWIEAHVRMFRFFGGVPRLVVPDNLKSGVHRASFYDPEINRSYGMMASHYGVGVLPARPRKPRDKAKVEAGVRFAQTYILGRLRRQTFFSLAEANAAIAAALERINAHIMRRLGVSRRQLFETVEMSVLASLPDADYQFAEWRVARVSLDYHVEIDGFFYSVPHGLIREQVDVRATTRTIELFHRGSRVAAHQRRYGGRRHGTDPDHMPSAHRRYAEWTPERFRRWGRSIGLNTEGLVLAILANRPHPEQGFRTCLGVLRLFKDLDPERAELIAARAVAVRALTYKSIASIIANKLDRSARPTDDVVVDHPNLRGPGIRQTQRSWAATGRDAALCRGLRAPPRCFTEPLGLIFNRDSFHCWMKRGAQTRRHDRWREPDTVGIGGGGLAIAHTRLADGDWTDPGHHLALRQVTVADHTLLAVLGLHIGMLAEKVRDLGLDRLRQQSAGPVTQDFGELVVEHSWLNQLGDVIVGHGISLLRWRSGGVKHPHDMPPSRFPPSPTFSDSSPVSPRRRKSNPSPV
ncbi:transposase [Bradyrhizobium liaoningense]